MSESANPLYQEAQGKKINLEEKIKKAVVEFETETALEVAYIGIERYRSEVKAGLFDIAIEAKL